MNPYTILGLEPACSDDDVRAAYRRLANIHHPDAGGKEGAFRSVHEAYQLLKTKDARRAYERAITRKVVNDLTEATTRIVDEFFESCRPRMEERK